MHYRKDVSLKAAHANRSMQMIKETCLLLSTGMKPIEVYELYGDDTPEASSSLCTPNCAVQAGPAPMMELINLYVISSAQGKRYISPFCWATRMAVAHKGLPVETIPWCAQLHCT